MSAEIAIVGIACRYPDAASPAELWETVLAQRRAFRRLPPERLRVDDYLGARDDPDAVYSTRAAVLDGWSFDRVGFRVGADSHRAADPAHWLALEVATAALADAGFAGGEGLPRESTGVLVGNSLTGEFSRAAAMRLRWPYVRRVVGAELAEEGWDEDRAGELLDRLEARFKAPFAPMGDESLAGGLSNTIAGRIANHFDLQGGAYTVDGACASSVLALANAASALAAGDFDVAVAGGVDLSLDPFELVGFARTGALTPDAMWVFDERSRGFVPGEGCGMVVLMRRADAEALGRRAYASVCGWGVSSDGRGGLTRPRVEGQLLAQARAYARAGFDIGTVTSFEGHGTGTAVGDATELGALVEARRAAGATAPAWVGSIKANIGHTKAAAGAAGAIKTALSLARRVVPPHTGWERPHPSLGGGLRLADEAFPWPEDRPLRAGVSGMGFGGINAHLVLAVPAAGASASPPFVPRPSGQDVELLLLAAATPAELADAVRELRPLVAGLSDCELGDLAAALAAEAGGGPVRAAVVGGDPESVAGSLTAVEEALAAGEELFDPRRGAFLGLGGEPPAIGLLFPGQGGAAGSGGGLWRRRFPALTTPLAAVPPAVPGETPTTDRAQPAIAAASAAGLRVLERLGVRAAVAVGHSLGELSALAWAGCLDEPALLRLAAARGRAMQEAARPDGAMAGLAAAPEVAAECAAGLPVVVAARNGPERTVVSGPAPAIEETMRRARERGVAARRLPVIVAFHSPEVAAAAPRLAAVLDGEELAPPRRPVVSTVTGARLGPGDDLRELLVSQVTAPVRFAEALAAAGPGIGLWIEVGPGTMLAELAAGLGRRALSLGVGGRSLGGLFQAVGALHALGAAVDHRPLFAGRFVRPFDRRRPRVFLANPCEEAPLAAPAPRRPAAAPPAPRARRERPADGGALEVVTALVAARTELPAASIRPEHRLLSDLHLSSLAAGQLVAEAADRLGLPPGVVPVELADAPLGDLAAALATGDRGEGPRPAAPAGDSAWVRPFVVDWVERAPREAGGPERAGELLAPAGHPLRDELSAALAAEPAAGRVVLLPDDAGPAAVELLLAAARAALADPAAGLVVVQPCGLAGGFARSLHLEEPALAVVVVEVPFGDPRAAGWAAAEAGALRPGFCEVRWDAEGVRREPRLRRLERARAEAAGPLPLAADDVLLASGGGQGIGALAARATARATGARLAILGRSDPASDRGLAGRLEALAGEGIDAAYERADLADRAAVERAVRRLEERLGPVTGLLHAAGRNRPCRVARLDAAEVAATLAPKIDGLRHLLAAVDPGRLRCLVAFGSIIARSGMEGEAHYALANEWLAREVAALAPRLPAGRCLTVEWSVWSGAGMGERLGAVERLAERGVLPIEPAAGEATLVDLLARPPSRLSVVVASRMGESPTLERERAEPPLLRFLEEPRVFYPGVEIVAEARISAGTDPYLADHVYEGSQLLPAVVGLEAMVQAVAAVARGRRPAVLEGVRFDRPVRVPEGGLRIQVAALAREDGAVEAVLRSEETGFSVDHFRLLWRPAGAGPRAAATALAAADGEPLPLAPDPDLYGPLLFHRGRFRRLRAYRRLTATECRADIAADGDHGWFEGFLPDELLLGDPGARDAAIHAVQACIPQGTVLPVGVERLELGRLDPVRDGTVTARERESDGDRLVYDLDVADADGRVVERWRGLELRVVARRRGRLALALPLVAPYAERRLSELLPGSEVRIELRPANGAAGGNGSHGPASSGARVGDFELQVTGRGRFGSRLLRVSPRGRDGWRRLLDAEGLALAERLVAGGCDDLDGAAARVSAARECLAAAGLGGGHETRLVAVGDAADGWSVLRSRPAEATPGGGAPAAGAPAAGAPAAGGNLDVATFTFETGAAGERVVLAVLGER